MTAAQRVRQRLSAGRKPERPAHVTIDDVVRRVVAEAERARNAMRDERLDGQDIRLGVIYVLPDKDGLDAMVGCKWLAIPLNSFTESLSKLTATLGAARGVDFLGLVWALLDRESSQGAMWARPLTSSPEAEEKLKVAQGLFK